MMQQRGRKGAAAGGGGERGRQAGHRDRTPHGPRLGLQEKNQTIRLVQDSSRFIKSTRNLVVNAK